MRADRARRAGAGRRRATLGLLIAVARRASRPRLVVAPRRDVLPAARGATRSALRFQPRGPQPAGDLAVVAIDDKTFDELAPAVAVPALAARAGDRRAAPRRAPARIVYDVQFTEPTVAREDIALYRRRRPRPRRRARHDARPTATAARNVLGGDDNLRRAPRPGRGGQPRRAAAAAIVQRFPAACGGLTSLAVGRRRRRCGAAAATRRLPRRRRVDRLPRPARHDPHLLVLRPGPAAASTPRACAARSSWSARGAPTLQDVHATPTGATA